MEWELTNKDKEIVKDGKTFITFASSWRTILEKKKGESMNMVSIGRHCDMAATLFCTDDIAVESVPPPKPAGYLVEFNIEKCEACEEKGRCPEYLYWHYIRDKIIDIMGGKLEPPQFSES